MSEQVQTREERDAELARMWNAGKALDEIARHFGMSPQWTYGRINYLRRHGWNAPAAREG